MGSVGHPANTGAWDDVVMTLMNDQVLALLRTWVPTQRWFPAKGHAIHLDVVHEFPLGEAAIPLSLVILRARRDAESWTLQVPLTILDSEPDDLRSVVGALPGASVLVDATRHPESALRLVRIVSGEEVAGAVHAELISPVSTEGGTTSVISGEQSNTSIVVRGVPQPSIAKVFRVLAPGDNPDVVVTAALTRLHCAAVPATRAALRADWGDGRTDLAVLSEFVEGARDGWQTVWQNALATYEGQAAKQVDFAGLGAAVFEVHRRLAEAFGDREGTAGDAAEMSRDLIARLDWARREAGALLDPVADALDRHRERLGTLPPPARVQRIHGDLHLGQVLLTPSDEWRILDFEGEPLRPLHERHRHEAPTRDLVGLVRSLDYAAAFARDRATDPRADATAWSTSAASALVDGYHAAGGRHEDARLFTALLLDKALYELVYELRNRPDWVDVPLRDILRILG